MHPFEDLIVADNGVGIHWFGQSSFGLKGPSETIVQVDPYYPRERPSERYIHSRPPLNEASLRTDFILLTHNHGDHTCLESIERIHSAYPEVQIVGPSESTALLEEAGIPADRLTVVTAGDDVALGPMTAHTVFAKPPDGDPDNDIAPPDVQHLGYVVETGAVRVYISGDPINTFADHESLLQPIRDLKPDIGLLTNHPVEGEFPFFDGSVKMAVELGLRAAVPAHYSCFPSRDYDPDEWALCLPPGGPQPVLIPYNQSILFKV